MPSIIQRLGLLLILTNTVACSQSKLLLINTLASWDDYTRVADIAYGSQPLQSLDLYTPNAALNKRATVIFFYGGCWGGCEFFPKEDYRFVAQALTTQGYSVIIPNYRHYPEVKFATIMQDTAAVVNWTIAHNDQNGHSLEPIFLMGHSAGAHLAAMLTFNEAYLKSESYRHIKGFIGLAGPYDFLPMTDEYQKIVFGPEQNYPATQPVNFVTGNEPPVLLLYGQQDETVKPKNLASLRQKVEQVGGCVETHEYPDLDHAFLLGALALPFQQQEPVLKDVLRFLENYTQSQQVCKH